MIRVFARHQAVDPNIGRNGGKNLVRIRRLPAIVGFRGHLSPTTVLCKNRADGEIESGQRFDPRKVYVARREHPGGLAA